MTIIELKALLMIVAITAFIGIAIYGPHGCDWAMPK